jgi:quercetin dioxygenase-like cupin family protein
MPSSIVKEPPVAHLIDMERVDTIDVLGPTIQFLTSPDDTDSPCIMRGTIPPHGSVPLHSHADPETFLLISGAVEGLVVADKDFTWVAIEPGQTFHVPPNAKHGWRNAGRTPAAMIVVSTSRMGRFFKEVGHPVVAGRPVPAPSSGDVERFRRTAERYGYWNATSEENARVGLSLPAVP